MLNDFNRDILNITAHRPWPMPSRPWIMTQTWHDLLFAHWPIDPVVMRPRVPAAFPLDLYQGRAWLGIVPFRMTNVLPRFVPALPGLSAFPELNVRTYVCVDEKPGVFFFSLDAGSRLAVTAARALLNLPYYSAEMRLDRRADGIHYVSRRTFSGAPPAVLNADYRPTSEAEPPRPGTLDHFLTERYCLYAIGRSGRPYRLDIHHPPWPLQHADAHLTVNTMAQAAALALPSLPPILHFAGRQDMVAWPPEWLEAAG